jgi:hypothetical protein
VETDEPRETAGTPAETGFKLERIETDDVGEELAVGCVTTATGGSEAIEEHDEVTDEEEGGPFVETTGATEFARGTDASNPVDAEPAGHPTANSEDEEDLDEESEESE